MALNGIMEPPIKGSFPPNHRKFPSTSNGFFNIRPIRRTLPEIKQEYKLPIRVIDSQHSNRKKYSRFNALQPENSSIDFSNNLEKSRSLVSSAKLSKSIESLNSNNLPLHSTFKLSKNFIIPPETKDISCETVSGLLRKKFETIDSYNEWTKLKVEPFLANLKKNIISAKPEYLEEYVIGYCAREAMGQPHPKVLELPKTADEEKNLNKKNARKSRVSFKDKNEFSSQSRVSFKDMNDDL